MDSIGRLNITKFKRISTKHEETFLQNFNSYCTLHNFKKTDVHRLAAFSLHLEAPAKIWYTGLGDIASWKTVEAAFKDRFDTNNTALFNINAEKFNSNTNQ